VCVPFTPDVARRMAAVLVEFADAIEAEGEAMN
jgi:hypothetical protein